MEELTQETKFKRKDVEVSADVVTVKLNPEERQLLEKAKQVMEQEKDSTALKQIAWYGAKELLTDKTSYLLETIYANKRKNKRLGIITFD